MTSRQIPYVILEAHPDYKRPCAIQRLGLVEETNLHSAILDILVEFVYDRINIECVKSVEDIETFWSNFYGDRYMCMSPWDASAFIDGKWKDIYISNEELFEALMKEYQKSEMSYKEEIKTNKNAQDEEGEEDENV